MDKEGFQYNGEFVYQTGRVEMIQNLEEMVLQGLMEYQQKLNEKPQRLIFFRDGVSESQFDQVLKNELPQIRKACQKLSIDANITLIICQKRHHHRFNTSGDDTIIDKKSKNLLPGTIIETGITHPTDYDFFLYSHRGIQGISRPCYYRVLLDENKIHPDQLHSFVYHSCYLFARCSRSVSIVPAVYYADLLCERGKRYITEEQIPVRSKKITGMYWV